VTSPNDEISHLAAIENMNRESSPMGERAVSNRLAVVVESDDTVRHLIERLLEKEGFVVLTASSAADAISICDGRHDRICLFVVEMHLRDMAGSQLYDIVRAKHPGIRPVFIASDAPDGELAPDPPRAVLARPFRPREFLSAIETASGSISPES
jgi:two-component system cell cycle sensor histidine kinase/response regulator CckA